MGYLIEDLLTSAKKRSFAPISQTTFQDDGLIEMATDELLLGLVADIMAVKEDFLLTQRDVPIVAGVQHYRIPERAVGNGLKALFYKDSGGNVSPGLTRTDVEYFGDYSGQGGGAPSKFYLEGDEVVLLPMPSGGGYLVQSFYQRPNRLVATTSCTKITVVTAGVSNVVFTVDTSLIATLAVGQKIDFLSAQSPFCLWARDVVIEAIDATTIQVALSDVVDGSGSVEPLVGDYICPKGTANIPMMPIEYHMILAQQLACAMLHSLGQNDKLAAAQNRLDRMRTQAGLLSKNRVENSPQMLKQRNNLARMLSR